jgi:hypothetical protein
MTNLEKELALMMKSIYDRAKAETGYNATVFIRMLGERGALGTAKYLLNEPRVSSGFVALYERGRLDLTLEAQLLQHEELWELFEDHEIDTARRWYNEFKDGGGRSNP